MMSQSMMQREMMDFIAHPITCDVRGSEVSMGECFGKKKLQLLPPRFEGRLYSRVKAFCSPRNTGPGTRTSWTPPTPPTHQRIVSSSSVNSCHRGSCPQLPAEGFIHRRSLHCIRHLLAFGQDYNENRSNDLSLCLITHGEDLKDVQPFCPSLLLPGVNTNPSQGTASRLVSTL